jgi:hypothetical protein
VCYQSSARSAPGASSSTGCSIPGQPEARGLRYKAIHLGELFFLENHQGIIDTAFRKFDLTARQAAQKFGPEKLPRAGDGSAAGRRGEGGKEILVHPLRQAARRLRPGPQRRRRACRSSTSMCRWKAKVTVQQGGFFSFPYSISRYTQAPGEIYGRSPAMLALPAIKVLNEEKKTVLKQGHRAVDPVLLAHDDGIARHVQPEAGRAQLRRRHGGRQAARARTAGRQRDALAKELMERSASRHSMTRSC